MPRSPKLTSLVITLGLTAAATFALSFFLDWSWLLAYLTAINLITFLIYAYDKHAARKHKSRVPESTLHLLALLGGSPAALAAQQFFRHKTVKRSFQLAYWAIVVLQVVVIVAVLIYT